MRYRDHDITSLRRSARLFVAALLATTAVAAAPSPAAAAAFEGGSPVRLADTREGDGPLSDDEILQIDAGAAGVLGPIVINLTAVNPSGRGFLAVFPCAVGPAGTSNLNFVEGATLANFAATFTDEFGQVCVQANMTAGGSVDVLVDLYGELDPATTFVPGAPGDPLSSRAFDTREGSGVKLPAGQVLVASGADPNSLQFLNITVAEPESLGFITAYPCAQGRPGTSNNNFVAGQARAGLGIVAADANGEICFFTSATTHLIVDQFMILLEDVAELIQPQRLMDTREGLAGSRGTAFELSFPGANGRAVALNITAVNPSAIGFVTPYPCADERPTASILNFRPPSATPNSVLIQPDAAGRVCFFARFEVDLLVDLFGYVG